ncbi:hypothetical protein FRB99_004707 [Tulasnella sp. 403]|nr:hypothetical protein FRB99_004707 [Tulasnella sp. 403]
MSLIAVAGRGDGGIDLQGYWYLPFVTPPPSLGGSTANTGKMVTSSTASTVTGTALSTLMPRRKIRVVAQCKAEKRAVFPKYVRELEGALSRRIHDQQQLHAAQNVLPVATDTLHEDPPTTVAFLISESPFSLSTIDHAMSSHLPLVLLHLPPPGSFAKPPSRRRGRRKESQPVESVPRVLAAATGMPNASLLKLAPTLEIRSEMLINPGLDKEVERLTLWWDGQPLQHWIPEVL